VIDEQITISTSAWPGQELTAEYLETRDCVLIDTNHSAYNCSWITQHAVLIVDTRNAMKGVAAPAGKIVQA
jgi:UDP-N-acetyl-D-glucosamine dehydrogenase